MSFPRALSFVLKRTATPGALKKEDIEKALAEEEPLKPFVNEVAAHFDEKTGKALQAVATKLRKIFSKHPALFSTVDVEAFFAEEKPEASAKTEGVAAPAPKTAAR